MNIKASKKLGFRMTTYCVLFAFFLSFFVGGMGVLTYYNNSLEHYEYYLLGILNVTTEGLMTDELEVAIHNSQKNAAFEDTQKKLNHIKDLTNIEYIYLMTENDGGGFMYIICGYTSEELKNPDSFIEFKTPVGTEVEPKMIDLFSAISQGESELELSANSSDLGYVMTVVIPLKNSQEEVIGVLAADVLMDDIIHDVMGYVRYVLLGIFIGTALFLVFFLFTIKKKIITPIIAIGEHLSGFVSQTQDKSSEMEVTELKIRTGDELQRLSEQLNRMMADMVTYMSGLESMTAMQERLNVQLDLARQVQQSMLPSTFPAFPERGEFDVYAATRSVGDVGSGFYDFFLIDGTHLGVVIGDVSGEGVPAALFMMRCGTLIKNYTRLGLEPAKVLFDCNNELCVGNNAHMTAEALVGILDVYNGEFCYANAGEHRPYVINSEGEVKEIHVNQGFLLGALENIPFYQEKIVLNKRDILCLFTNGIFRMLAEGEKRQDVEEILRNMSVNDQTKINEMVKNVEEEWEAVRKLHVNGGVEGGEVLESGEGLESGEALESGEGLEIGEVLESGEGLEGGEGFESDESDSFRRKNEDLTVVMLMFEGFSI